MFIDSKYKQAYNKSYIERLMKPYLNNPKEHTYKTGTHIEI